MWWWWWCLSGLSGVVACSREALEEALRQLSSSIAAAAAGEALHRLVHGAACVQFARWEACSWRDMRFGDVPCTCLPRVAVPTASRKRGRGDGDASDGAACHTVEVHPRDLPVWRQLTAPARAEAAVSATAVGSAGSLVVVALGGRDGSGDGGGGGGGDDGGGGGGGCDGGDGGDGGGGGGDGDGGTSRDAGSGYSQATTLR